MNQKFLRELYLEFGAGTFTNKDAYRIYLRHIGTEHNDPDDVTHNYWRNANVRMTLACADYFGILTRVDPGKYQFHGDRESIFGNMMNNVDSDDIEHATHANRTMMVVYGLSPIDLILNGHAHE